MEKANFIPTRSITKKQMDLTDFVKYTETESAEFFRLIENPDIRLTLRYDESSPDEKSVKRVTLLNSTDRSQAGKVRNHLYKQGFEDFRFDYIEKVA